MNIIKTAGGSGGLFLIFVVLLILKLAGVITMSWWLVTLPLWIVWAIIAGIFIGAAALVAVVYPFVWLFSKI